MPWLIEPSKNQLPVHTEDLMLHGFTYQDVIDTFHANVPSEQRNRESLRRTVKEMIEECEKEVWESFDLCWENILK